MDDPVKQTNRNQLPPGPGRPKGIPNKVSRIAKEAIAQVFEDLGSVEAMTEWARDNPTSFYNMYAKLLPIQVDGAGENGEHLISNVTISLVKAGASEG